MSNDSSYQTKKPQYDIDFIDGAWRATRDIDAEVDRYVKLVGIAVLTPNQVINLLGMGEEYPDGDKHYILSTLTEVGIPAEMTKQEDFTNAILKFRRRINEITEEDE